VSAVTPAPCERRLWLLVIHCLAHSTMIPVTKRRCFTRIAGDASIFHSAAIDLDGPDVVRRMTENHVCSARVDHQGGS
jgi:hypothetical protein